METAIKAETGKPIPGRAGAVSLISALMRMVWDLIDEILVELNVFSYLVMNLICCH
jgi:hypothetical protein